MILVDAHGLSASRPGRALFKAVNVTVSSGERLGVVGVNGTGKSTLLRVLAGVAEPDGGVIRRGRGVQVEFLGQHAMPPPGTLADAVMSGGSGGVGGSGGGVDSGGSGGVGNSGVGGSGNGDRHRRWEVAAMLDRFGLGGSLLDADVSALSMGQARRAALALALSAEADLLLLDEPTNHLDLDAAEWLETELHRFRGGLVIVTHDRRLLDGVSTHILELDRGRAYRHECGYAGYLEARAARESAVGAAEMVRRNLAKRELAWLRRGAPARTGKAKARLTKAKAIVESRPQASARRGPLALDRSVSGQVTPRLGSKVIELRRVDAGYEGASPLVRDCDLLIGRHERLGVVGANGVGKSTLLDVMAGRLEPLAGRVSVGATVRIGYYDQRHRELDPRLRVYETVTAPGASPTGWGAAMLERFWFDADVQRSPVELLSGGERRRLQLVRTLAAAPNVLLLDEPTNDLDLDTLRALEDFLDDWPGTVVAASHDRAFLDRVVDHVIVLDGSGRAGRWPGGHAAWLEHRRVPRDRRSRQSDDGGSDGRSNGGSDGVGGVSGVDGRGHGGRSASTIRFELRDAERVMDDQQRRVDTLQAGIADSAEDHESLASLGRELAEASMHRDEAEDRWLVLTLELEERLA